MREAIRVGIIGGSGLGEALLAGLEPADVESHSLDTPFGPPSGPVVTARRGTVQLALLQRHGPGHALSPSAVPYRANIFALKSLGCTHIIASGAVGSLRESISPGDLVICDQLIDRTVARPRTFFEQAAVHVEFAEPFCPVMRRWLLDAGASLPEIAIHDRGCYVCIEGPSFSTRAESHLHRRWGADVVGMTALPEARLAREAEMAYALIALPTDFDCWRPRNEEIESSTLLDEILSNLRGATEASLRLIGAALGNVPLLDREPSPAHEALRLAIWSSRQAIPRDEVERLRVIWGRWF